MPVVAHLRLPALGGYLSAGRTESAPTAPKIAPQQVAAGFLAVRIAPQTVETVLLLVVQTGHTERVVEQRSSADRNHTDETLLASAALAGLRLGLPTALASTAAPPTAGLPDEPPSSAVQRSCPLLGLPKPLAYCLAAVD